MTMWRHYGGAPCRHLAFAVPDAAGRVAELFQRTKGFSMPFFKSIPADAGPAKVFTTYPEIYRLWSTMSQALMNGPSPLTQAERELLFAYAAGVAGCKFVYVAHSEVAYAWGIARGVLDRLLENLETAPVEARLKPLLAFVRKLMLTPG